MTSGSGEESVMRLRSSWTRKELKKKHQEEVSIKTRRCGMKQEERGAKVKKKSC